MVFNRAAEWPQIIGLSRPLEGLSEPEQLLAAFFASSSIGLSIIDAQLNYLAINKALADMNGLPAEVHLGKSVREVLGSAADAIEPILHRVVLTGKGAMNVELTAQLPTRTEMGHWVVHYFPMNDASGKLSRIGVVVVEVTKQKRLKKERVGLVFELEQKTERLKLLLEIGTALNLTPDWRDAFPSISANIRRVLQHDWIDLSILDESSESIRIYALDTVLDLRSAGSDISIPLSGAFCGEAVVECHPKVFSRSDLAAIHSPLVDQMLQAGIQSACCVPFATPRGAVGSFNAASINEHHFHSEHIELLEHAVLQLSIALDNTLMYQEISLKSEAPEGQTVKAETEINSELNFTEIVGESPALRQVLNLVKKVAPSDATVLILGETGTGKELIARAIHHMSLRRDGPFIKLNCAAIPSELLESELFGHEKGAFTGAITQKIGRLEVADQGTLFLDEIGDIPLELQPKLLRVLQDQEFERLGSNRTIRVNVRLLAATNLNLGQRVAERGFRADLFYRLNVFPIRMPSLGERGGDVPLLVRHFVQKHARKMNKKIETIPAEVMHALTTCDWPGNIRELENFIERSVILSQGSVLEIPLVDLRPLVTQPLVTSEHVGREYVLRVLRRTKGSIEGPRGAAAQLGMAPGTLRSTMKRMNILPKNYQT